MNCKLLRREKAGLSRAAETAVRRRLGHEEEVELRHRPDADDGHLHAADEHAAGEGGPRLLISANLDR